MRVILSLSLTSLWVLWHRHHLFYTVVWFGCYTWISTRFWIVWHECAATKFERFSFVAKHGRLFCFFQLLLFPSVTQWPLPSILMPMFLQEWILLSLFRRSMSTLSMGRSTASWRGRGEQIVQSFWRIMTLDWIVRITEALYPPEINGSHMVLLLQLKWNWTMMESIKWILYLHQKISWLCQMLT